MLTKSFTLSANDPTANWMRFALKSPASQRLETIQLKEPP
jgi:hypothetical protein